MALKQARDKPKEQTYRGWTLKRVEGATQVGYALPNARSIGQRLGFKTHRKINGYELITPEGENVKWCDTLKQAREYVDNYG